jgi:cytidine deaminase
MTVQADPIDFDQLAARVSALRTSSKMVFEPGEMVDLCRQLQLTYAQMMQVLIVVAQGFSRSPISKFKVGAVVEVSDGTCLLGTNLEFQGQPLNQSVHAEQFATVLARHFGFETISKLHISAEPCGHCRQWLNEIKGAEKMKVQIHGPSDRPTEASEASDLGSYSRNLFGPKNLGVVGDLLTPTSVKLQRVQTVPNAKPPPLRDDLVQATLQQAEKSYAPYSKSYAAVGLLLDNDQVVTGPYLENCAFNPSLQPFQAARIAQMGLGLGQNSLREVVLVEACSQGDPQVSHQRATEGLLEAEGFRGPFAVIRVRVAAH